MASDNSLPAATPQNKASDIYYAQAEFVPTVFALVVKILLTELVCYATQSFQISKSNANKGRGPVTVQY